MAQRLIVWTKTADLQFVGVLEYWYKRNKSTSYPKKLIALVTQRTNQIAETPFIFRPADFRETRVSLIGNFSIFYKIEDNRILITAFWDNRQNPRKLLEILQKD